MKEDHLKMQKIINMEYNVYLKEGIRGLDTPMTTFAFVTQQGRDGKDGKPGLTGMKGSRGDTGTRGSEGIAGISGPRVCSFVIKNNQVRPFYISFLEIFSSRPSVLIERYGVEPTLLQVFVVMMLT